MNRILKVMVLLLFLAGCSDNKEIEKKWRVLDEQKYAPEIDRELLEGSLDELEKLIFAPSQYFKEKGDILSFRQNLKYQTESEVKEENRTLILEEEAKYSADEKNNYVMHFTNNRNEGWDIIWKDNFFYRKQFGGEFAKTFSMGEHIYLREAVFGSIPSIYSVLRDHAQIETSGTKTKNGIKGTEIIISFVSKKLERDPFEEKKYLQNLQGTEEMKDDNLIASLTGKEKKDVSGSMTLFINDKLVITEMSISAGFVLTNEMVKFSIEGKRILNKKQTEKIEVPVYNEEYHRRTLDAAVNIMKETKNDKE
ncbi:MAG TPA: hypothetical protein PKG52_01125 [bacterium]|nr:hypothetical protein [bacterium]HPS29416.1 hypothetical protein [bacterium]